LEHEWLTFKGVPEGGTLNERWLALFGFPGNFNGAAYRWLVGNGVEGGGTLNEMWYKFWGSGGAVDVENLIVNSRWLGVAGSVGGADFAFPADWTGGFWPPTDAIAYNADAENEGIQFISTADRGFVNQDIDVTPYVGQQVSISIFVDEAIETAANRLMHISNGATQDSRVPAPSVGFTGRLYGVYTITDPTITVRVGAGTTINSTENIRISRPSITVGPEEKVYVPTDPTSSPTTFADQSMVVGRSGNLHGFRFGLYGSLDPAQTPENDNFVRLTVNNNNGSVRLRVNDIYPQDVFSTITINGFSLNSADATYSNPAGDSRWVWTGTGISLTEGETVPVDYA
jgi:hypothetical protein